jgi:dimethylargininase
VTTTRAASRTSTSNAELTALVREPSARLADGLLTHIERVPVDVELARRQWSGYFDALRTAGWATRSVSAADDCADSVFVEDTVVMVGGTAVITRPGADARRPEIDGTAAALAELGYPITATSLGTLDGGDVLKVGGTVYVGRTLRTSAEGIAEFRRLVQPLGAQVVAVPTTKVLHLKSAVTALPDGTIIGYPPLIDDPAFWPLFRPVPEEAGSHVVDLGGGRLLLSAAAPRSADLIADLGFEPVLVDIGEFEKLEGCVTCLSVRLRQPPDEPR